MLSGTDSADGFLSQKEYLCEWGKRILIGSGLLGRTPMDVVAVETCLVEKIVIFGHYLIQCYAELVCFLFSSNPESYFL